MRATPGDRVGPVLQPGPLCDAIVAAIRRRHPDVEVVDRGGYVRVLVPRACVLERTAVERLTGASFHLPCDLEAVMPSFQGRLEVESDVVVWRAGPGARS